MSPAVRVFNSGYVLGFFFVGFLMTVISNTFRRVGTQILTVTEKHHSGLLSFITNKARRRNEPTLGFDSWFILMGSGQLSSLDVLVCLFTWVCVWRYVLSSSQSSIDPCRCFQVPSSVAVADLSVNGASLLALQNP